MMAGLDTDPITGVEHPPVLATEIKIDDRAKLSLLEARFREYQATNRPFGMSSEGEGDGGENLGGAERIAEQVAKYGPDRYPAIFKEVILGIVLALAQEERDLKRFPILLQEIAVEAMEVTHLDVSQAAIGNHFKYDEERGVHELDLASLFEKAIRQEVTLADIGFLEAYATVMEYARSVTQGSTSPTGIPNYQSFPKK